ncbi:MAG: hypothetical protein ACE5JH_07880 [Acidobacteriota bacterium]
MEPTVLLIGLGHLGGVVLELLAREPGIARVVACSRDPARGTARCNLARLGAVAQGCAPRIEYLPLDLDDPEGVAAAVRRIAPDIVLSTASMQTWWLTELLPPEAAAPLREARFGIWLPVHMALTLKLMRALRRIGYGGVTLTAPFPDVVNCVLGRLGLAPTCGVGNIAEIVPKIRLLASRRLGARLDSVRVLLVGHHALEAAALSSDPGDLPPYHLEITADGDDVTHQLPGEELLRAPCPLPGGPARAFLTAGATSRLVRALVAGRETLQHAPAPAGLPGGYPVRVGRGRVRPAPIGGLSLQDAIAINERSHRFDGIERIEPDGTAVFRAESVEAVRRALGYECARLAPDDSEARGRELMARFREYAGRHGVKL